VQLGVLVGSELDGMALGVSDIIFALIVGYGVTCEMVGIEVGASVGAAVGALVPKTQLI
jgi:hypothetical protein